MQDYFMEQGVEPDVRKYLKKVLNSFFIGLLWLTANVVAGIYFELAYRDGKPLIFVILFYIFFTASLFFLLRYYYRTWKK